MIPEIVTLITNGLSLIFPSVCYSPVIRYERENETVYSFGV